MVASRARQWFVVFLVVSFAVSAVMLLAWRAHAQFSARRSLAAITPSAADTRTIPYRVEQLEEGMERIREQHERITWLLVVNLAGVSGSLGTYILTNRRRFFQAQGGKQWE
jgi:uncharacterized membrane protein